MSLDANVCLCFHVSRRKLESYVRIERPRFASQLSECGGAGTGCGWCIPFLKDLHATMMLGQSPKLMELTPECYASRRAEYLEHKKRLPGSGEINSSQDPG